MRTNHVKADKVEGGKRKRAVENKDGEVRAKKVGKTAAAPKAKPEKAKKEEAVFDRAAEEKALAGRYPDQSIVPGSLQDVTGKGEFAQKRSVEIECQKCKSEGRKTVRRIATSDLHQVRNCDECVKQIRLDRRKVARAEARQESGLPPLGAVKEKAKVKKDEVKKEAVKVAEVKKEALPAAFGDEV